MGGFQSKAGCCLPACTRPPHDAQQAGVPAAVEIYL